MRWDMMFLASNNLHNLRGQKWSWPCYHARHLQQIHWNKFLCRMYGFMAKSFIARLNIVRLLIRKMGRQKICTSLTSSVPPISIYPPPLVTYLKNAPLLVCSLQMSIVIFSIINMFWQDFFLLAWKTSKNKSFFNVI